MKKLQFYKPCQLFLVLYDQNMCHFRVPLPLPLILWYKMSKMPGSLLQDQFLLTEQITDPYLVFTDPLSLPYLFQVLLRTGK